MRKPTHWARFAIGSAALSLCVAACDSVLDIEDPKMRPSEAGVGGEPTEPLLPTGGSGSGSGGANGGAADNSTPMGGTGAGGEPPVIVASAGAGGEGGAPVTKECADGDVQCGGDAQKTPQVCDRTGHWVANATEGVGDCEIACVAGECTECVEHAKRCRVCADGDAECDTNLPQTCEDGVWVDEDSACAQYCDAGSCITTPSCSELNELRTTCQGTTSCCRSLFVPGGTFKRDFDNAEWADDTHPAEISSFLLDKFEVTVGRMRQFVDALPEVKLALHDGSGKSPHIEGDTGWNTAFGLPADKATLVTALATCVGTTWSNESNINNDLPLNCVPFNVAYAFCIWDGGRLPTETEWNFAAAGGDEQRIYPWKAPTSGPAITNLFANYLSDDNPSAIPVAVGNTPLGDGRWGQSDLAGNVTEWTLDYYGDYPATCDDCLNTAASSFRSARGGAYSLPLDGQVASFHTGLQPTESRPEFGFRCARDLN